MNIKNICKILSSTATVLGVVALVGILNNNPVYAAETENQVSSEVTTDSAVSVKQNNEKDYSIEVNQKVEKQGFKIEIKNVTATKHKMKVVATIQGKDSYKDERMNNIVQLTVLNTKCENHMGSSQRKIDDKTMEYTFNIESFEGFGDNVTLRLDAALPQYDINAWVKAHVNISKNFENKLDKDINFNIGDLNFYKVESDILGTSLFCKDNESREAYTADSYDNKYCDSDSKLLLKCKDKLYEFNERNSFLDKSDVVIGEYTIDNLTYDDLKNAGEYSIIPIRCKLTHKEQHEFYDKIDHSKPQYDETEKVQYIKDFDFADGSKGVISKIERKDGTIKVYCKSDNDKNAMLMAIALNGWYERRDDDDDDYDYDDIEKVMYKDPAQESGYIVEFNNVRDGKLFKVNSYNSELKQNDKFDIGEEVKAK